MTPPCADAAALCAAGRERLYAPGMARVEVVYRWITRLPWLAFAASVILVTTTRRGTVPYEIGLVVFGCGLGGMVMASLLGNYGRWRDQQPRT